MMFLNESGVDVLIKKISSPKSCAFWNNYDLVVWHKDASGYMHKNGMFKKEWGLAETIAVNEQGVWKLPKRYVKYFK
jgi:hypothetical protein